MPNVRKWKPQQGQHLPIRLATEQRELGFILYPARKHEGGLMPPLAAKLEKILEHAELPERWWLNTEFFAHLANCGLIRTLARLDCATGWDQEGPLWDSVVTS